MLINFIERRLFRAKRERTFWQAIAIDVSAILLWRGLWGMMDLYIFPDHQEMSFIFSAAIGLVMLLVLRPYVK